MLFSVFANVVIMPVYAPGHRGRILNPFYKKKVRDSDFVLPKLHMQLGWGRARVRDPSPVSFFFFENTFSGFFLHILASSTTPIFSSKS